MALILTAAAGVSLLAGSYKDAVTISAIVVLFALLGFFQDYRAEKAIAALRRLAVPMVRVKRDGEVKDLPSSELVPGDIVMLESGNLVPADCLILEAHAVKVQEAILTGESEATEKRAGALAARELPLGERRNQLFMGTMVATGRAVAVVVATGMQTELGRIAALLQQVGQEWTPLQKRLDRLGKVLAVVSVAVALIIFVVGLLRGESLREMLLMSVSIAVAAIPEGLPAVVTITLALGAQRMLGHNALIRRLPAVETLGSVTVICSDKTGTLTQNVMTVTGLVSGSGLKTGQQTVDNRLLLIIGALCNDAIINCDEAGHHNLLGDPTEGAILTAAATEGIYREELEKVLPRIAEIPFDSTTRRMITVHGISGDAAGFIPPLALLADDKLLAAKGATDAVLTICDRILAEEAVQPLTEELKRVVQAEAERLSSRGERVLTLAMRPLRPEEDDSLESLPQRFIYLGLAAMSDPPRQEALGAVQRCKSAGIRPVMITGDHPLTAGAIARQVGIEADAGVLTGQELERLSPAELDRVVGEISIYARVAPEHKLRIVESIQRLGGVAAMTGDGVNDAPALKKADVGVAMGRGGTEVAREAADMVLLDDNFATIVAAVEEGRTIYENIRKFVVFSVAGNTGKIMSVLLLPFMGLPMPLTPLQLLWLNLLTDGLLGLGIGVERPEPDLMNRPPIPRESQIFDGGTIRYVLITGSLIGGACMGVTFLVWQNGGPWQTVLFASLALAQVAQAMALRSFRSSFFTLGLFTNPLLISMAFCVVLLQSLVLYLPQLQLFFRTAALTADQLWLTLLPAIAVFILLEGEKWGGRLGRRKNALPVSNQR
jgi:Ca2+-transporting ATPase